MTIERPARPRPRAGRGDRRRLTGVAVTTVDGTVMCHDCARHPDDQVEDLRAEGAPCIEDLLDYRAGFAWTHPFPSMSPTPRTWPPPGGAFFTGVAEFRTSRCRYRHLRLRRGPPHLSKPRGGACHDPLMLMTVGAHNAATCSPSWTSRGWRKATGGSRGSGRVSPTAARRWSGSATSVRRPWSPLPKR
jgi:hypothetical protein